MRKLWLMGVLLLWAVPSWAQVARLPDLEKAIVPVVYPLEHAGRTASGCERIRYTFFGNAFFVGCNGLLLTAAHVLEPFPNPDEISILLPDEKNALPGGDCWRLARARLVAQDRDADLAFLQVEAKEIAGTELEHFRLAKDAPAMGAPIEIAVFKPARASSWTDGAARIETRRGSIAQVDGKRMRRGASLIDVYLLSYEVVQGESGAPLYHSESGEVVGVVSGISGGTQPKASRDGPARRGAAVPVGYVRPLLAQTGCAPGVR